MHKELCACGNPGDGWPNGKCQDCWDRYCDEAIPLRRLHVALRELLHALAQRLGIYRLLDWLNRKLGGEQP